jgi:hypothetical protein
MGNKLKEVSNMPRDMITKEIKKEELSVDCKLFGQYESDDDACKICGVSDECKALSEGLDEDINTSVDSEDNDPDPEDQISDDDSDDVDLDGISAKDEETDHEEIKHEEINEPVPSVEPEPQPLPKKKKGRPLGSTKKPTPNQPEKDKTTPKSTKPSLAISEDNEIETEKIVKQKEEDLILSFKDITVNLAPDQLKKITSFVEAGMLIFILLHESLKS